MFSSALWVILEWLCSDSTLRLPTPLSSGSLFIRGCHCIRRGPGGVIHRPERGAKIGKAQWQGMLLSCRYPGLPSPCFMIITLLFFLATGSKCFTVLSVFNENRSVLFISKLHSVITLLDRPVHQLVNANV